MAKDNVQSTRSNRLAQGQGAGAAACCVGDAGLTLPSLSKGRYRARFAQSAEDLRQAQALRYRAFYYGTGAQPNAAGLDADAFDEHCRHVLVEEDGGLVCCFRLLELADGAGLSASYSAQFYDLSALAQFHGPMIELGRFCIAPGRQDADILRVAWAMLTKLVDASGVKLLFGCSSFAGTDPALHLAAFDELQRKHLAPPLWAPKRRSAELVPLAAAAATGTPAEIVPLGAATATKPVPLGSAAAATAPVPLAAAPVPQPLTARDMPPLLRSYLAMGGWVSDHAVIDRQLNTMHVFTGLEIDAIPPARARLLRAVAG